MKQRNKGNQRETYIQEKRQLMKYVDSKKANQRLSFYLFCLPQKSGNDLFLRIIRKNIAFGQSENEGNFCITFVGADN